MSSDYQGWPISTRILQVRGAFGTGNWSWVNEQTFYNVHTRVLSGKVISRGTLSVHPARTLHRTDSFAWDLRELPAVAGRYMYLVYLSIITANDVSSRWYALCVWRRPSTRVVWGDFMTHLQCFEHDEGRTNGLL